MNNLKGKVAIVTGASKGIGAGIAKQMAAAGAAVVVNYASSKEGADRVVDAITSQGGKAVAIQGDVSNARDVQTLFAAAKKAFGRLDIVVNNAGIYQFEPLESVTEAEFHRDQLIAAQLLQAFRCLGRIVAGDARVPVMDRMVEDVVREESEPAWK